MKIIRHGAGPKWWVGKRGECEECHSMVELEPEDKVKEYRKPIPAVYFKCPECGKEMRIYHA